MLDADSHLHVVILAGGVGSRFWPASTPTQPKPLLSLGGTERPLIAETMDRALGLAPSHRVAILAGHHLASALHDVLPELDPTSVWIEPHARGTGPALAWAAHRISQEDPQAVMVSLHADHLIQPDGAFLELVTRAAKIAAMSDILLTIAVRPNRPETGYGYLNLGDPIGPEGDVHAWKVSSFMEKPDEAAAVDYIAQGYAWNTGIFILPVTRFLEEIRTHAHDIGRQLPRLDRGEICDFFEAVPSISVDRAVLEHSDRLGAMLATFKWDDVGTWEALTRTRPPDEAGNWTTGEVHALDAAGAVVWAEDGPVVLFGVNDLIVVRSHGVTLVASRGRAAALKELVGRLPLHLQDPMPVIKQEPDA